VDIVKKVHSHEEDVEEGDRKYKHLLPLGNMYGRVTSHPCDDGDCGPQKLSEGVGRKTVFLFGADAIEATVLECNTFDTLIELGLTKELIVRKVSYPRPYTQYTFLKYIFRLWKERTHFG